MEAIDPFSESSFPAAQRDRRRVARKRSEPAAFASALETAEESEGLSLPSVATLAESDEGLEALLDTVHEVGEKLKDRVSLSVVQEYKLAVRAFLSYVVRNTLSVERHESGPNVIKRKRFTLIKVIDQKLERLAAGILLDQQAQLEILRRIDEISGLLIDLLS